MVNGKIITTNTTTRSRREKGKTRANPGHGNTTTAGEAKRVMMHPEQGVVDTMTGMMGIRMANQGGKVEKGKTKAMGVDMKVIRVSSVFATEDVQYNQYIWA